MTLDRDGLRELIRNERRLELCFEDFRFWDLRRWKEIETMNASVMGVNIAVSDGTSFNIAPVEERKFSQDMIYGPIPYEETRKYNLEQNKGW